MASKPQVLAIVASAPEHFRSDFLKWLDENFHVYNEFERRAQTLHIRGRAHYGARALWESMRFDSAIGELKGEFKLNDHRPPDVARLCMLANPPMKGMFETRSSPLSRRII